MFLYSIMFSTIFFMTMAPPLQAGGGDAVYISPDSPYLGEISRILQEKDYRMYTDSLENAWVGALETEALEDSLRYHFLIKSPDGLTVKELGNFSRARLSADQKRRQVRLMAILQGISAVAVLLLYFIRL